MKQAKILIVIGALTFSILACSLGSRPSNADLQATTAALAVQAEAAAGTAAVAASTIAAQGGEALETIQASDFDLPDLNTLREKFAAVRPDENGDIMVTIQESDVTKAIRARQQAALAEGQSATVQNPTVQFTTGNIIFSGDVTSPTQARLTVTFQPTVVDGRVQFTVVSATVGEVQVPPALLQTAESALNNSLGEAINRLPDRITVQKMVVGTGTLTIFGHFE